MVLEAADQALAAFLKNTFDVHNCGIVLLVGTLVTVCVLLTAALQLVSFLHRTLVRPGKPLKSFGKWAVVTGATDGIGEAVAHRLAAGGMDIVLVSRTQSKLDAVAAAIVEKHGVATRTVAVDMADDEDAVAAVAAEVKRLDVGVLVNNVGMSYDHPDYFADVDIDSHKRLHKLNIDVLMELSHAILPGMVTRRRGAIVNISSAAGQAPSPLLATYSASKVYVQFLSEALALEYGPKGISVQCCVPAFVTSKLSKIRKPSITTPTPATFAKSLVAAIGYETVSIPYWAHAIQLYIFGLVPSALSNSFVMNMHKGLRSRALKKKQK